MCKHPMKLYFEPKVNWNIKYHNIIPDAIPFITIWKVISAGITCSIQGSIPCSAQKLVTVHVKSFLYIINELLPRANVTQTWSQFSTFSVFNISEYTCTCFPFYFARQWNLALFTDQVYVVRMQHFYWKIGNTAYQTFKFVMNNVHKTKRKNRGIKKT